MRYPKIRELKEAVVSLFTAPYTTKFPEEPHIPFEKFRGKPVVNNVNCVGCVTCSNVCPAFAITIEDNKKTGIRKITRDYGKCIFCGQCEAYCITGDGVVLSDEIFDLSTFDRKDKNTIEVQEKELLLCDHCNAVITTREHIRYLHKKLGPKAYATLLNLNTQNTELKLAEEDETKTEIIEDVKRKDMFNILCPNCLHTVLVRNLRHDG
jgi:hydrogenase-4 component H